MVQCFMSVLRSFSLLLAASLLTALILCRNSTGLSTMMRGPQRVRGKHASGRWVSRFLRVVSVWCFGVGTSHVKSIWYVMRERKDSCILEIDRDMLTVVPLAERTACMLLACLSVEPQVMQYRHVFSSRAFRSPLPRTTSSSSRATSCRAVIVQPLSGSLQQEKLFVPV